jgi:two-component system OmpR family sensor kinase
MRFPGRRLRSRIIWTTAVVSAIAMAAMVGTVLLVLTTLTRNSVDSTLRDRLSVISSGIQSDAGGPSRALETPDDAIDDTTWLFDSKGAELDGPRAGTRIQAVADSLAHVTKRTLVERRERVYLAAPVSIRGPHPSRGVLIVSESLEPYETTRVQIIVGLVALGLVVTAGATGIAAWTVGRTLAPVESMALRAEDWSEHALDARFDDTAADDEIAHLGRTLNVLLDRVAGALRSEQRLTSELAHELRTPLTAIRGEAELGLMMAQDPGTAQRLERVVSLSERMSTTISTLVAIARGKDQSGHHASAAEVVRATLESRPEPLDTFVVEGTDSARVAATREIAVRALSPLVDNAVRHAAATVSVRTTVTEREVGITVSDDGPGISEHDTEQLFRAGGRGNGSPGAGLGLALARRVARTLGGEVEVTSSSAPTSFTLTLPRY